ncbi:MAG: FliM/FliN family flagellar motor switch protein [Gammaproteobacteria bacterium]
MEESKILSTEEVDALSKIAQPKENDLIFMTSTKPNVDTINPKALNNIGELCWSECEKVFSTFLRRKIIVKLKSTRFGTVEECLEGKTEKHVYSVFMLSPSNLYALAIVDLPFLQQMINILYGGTTSENEPPMESAGKVGRFIAERISQLAMEGFSQACKEYGSINYESIKTVITPNLISKLSMEERVYAMDFMVMIGTIETGLSIILTEEFLQKFIPQSVIDVEYVDNAKSWRNIIEKEVIDSYVTLSVTLPEINIRASDLMNMKSGDLIPISDPTQVEVCLNNMKLFRANAAQANSNMVVKILGEI